MPRWLNNWMRLDDCKTSPLSMNGPFTRSTPFSGN